MEKLANYVALFLPYYELNGPSDTYEFFAVLYISHNQHSAITRPATQF